MQYRREKAELERQLSIIARNTEVPAGVKERLEIRGEIAQFLKAGYTLAAVCEDESKPIPTDESVAWMKRVEAFLAHRLGKGYATLFKNEDGIQVVVSIADEKRAELLGRIKMRATRLTQFMAEMRD